MTSTATYSLRSDTGLMNSTPQEDFWTEAARKTQTPMVVLGPVTRVRRHSISFIQPLDVYEQTCPRWRTRHSTYSLNLRRNEGTWIKTLAAAILVASSGPAMAVLIKWLSPKVGYPTASEQATSLPPVTWHELVPEKSKSNLSLPALVLRRCGSVDHS